MQNRQQISFAAGIVVGKRRCHKKRAKCIRPFNDCSAAVLKYYLVSVYKLRFRKNCVILAKAEIQSFQCLLDPPVKPEDDKT